jgi:DNA-binding MarR family transcriptional regulator
MIRIVSDLENRQLIRRQHRPNNARVLEATITGDGRSRLAHAHTLVADIESTMMAGMGASETKALQRLLVTIAENLDNS